VRMSSTENEHDGLGTNMRLETSVGLRFPIWGEEIDLMPFSLVARNILYNFEGMSLALGPSGDAVVAT